MTSRPAPQTFRFDRQLWDRFIAIAQPFFLPITPGSTWLFAGLLLVLMVTVVAATFWITVGLTLLGQTLFPAFFTNLAGGLVETINGLLASPVAYLAAAALVGSGSIFVLLRKRLRRRERQWLMLGILLFLSFAVNGLNVAISYVFRFIDNALNGKDSDTFYQFLAVYTAIIVGAIPIIIAYTYIRRKLGLIWREWLTKDYLDRYFSDRAYYKLDSNTLDTEIDNPDQRITADITSFTGTTLVFILDILDSILTLISFTLVLYTISKALTLGLVGYAFMGTAVAVVAGGKLIAINYNQLRLEADFRYGMVHVRDNSESIAFYRGETLERQQILDRLGRAIQNFDLLIIWESIIMLFQRGYNYFTRIVPYLIVAPLYFAGQMDFGAIGQAYLAFFQVLGALSIVTNQIQDISAFGASINRLGALDERLQPVDGAGRDRSPAPTPQGDRSGIVTQVESHVALDNLTLQTPNAEQTLIQGLSLALQFQDQLLVVGPSGCGKSSLLRAIAGLWTTGDGTITRPDSGEMLFLPQRPYMLLGTLRDQLIYPNPRNSIPEANILEALQQVNLVHLPDRLGGLDVERDWPTVLSLGEQQRLAFARILLTQPRYVILDEATSALDVANERNLYDLLQQRELLYISVGHRPSLLAYHQTVLELSTATTWRLLSAADYRFNLENLDSLEGLES
ncbi:ABC transporter ATP-binding protein/permease [Prochlorothrix hollandica]|uniref:ABC transporter ATP-binding protein n=1 Tax=Prochlorothrix hollandica PCC 9006 = CALU 1027 TaxID=317619 RepID=A0A0M2PVY4_PROHO|nr:ABC transporter ATP-binding protein/permease [Prochlorothrix hollandica]KKI99262.1 ABC transporter ATP-binding protein [Prochlorothrix hollandica PCC 9006 = CALU 1027]